MLYKKNLLLREQLQSSLTSKHAKCFQFQHTSLQWQRTPRYIITWKTKVFSHDTGDSKHFFKYIKKFIFPPLRRDFDIKDTFIAFL